MSHKMQTSVIQTSGFSFKKKVEGSVNMAHIHV